MSNTLYFSQVYKPLARCMKIYSLYVRCITNHCVRCITHHSLCQTYNTHPSVSDITHPSMCQTYNTPLCVRHNTPLSVSDIQHTTHTPLSVSDIQHTPFCGRHITHPSLFQMAVRELIHLCKCPPPPIATCRYEDCINNHYKVDIYENDLDFKVGSRHVK